MSRQRYLRQSFLGANAEAFIPRLRVGIVGLGGGGSHIVQQLAHIGFRDYVVYDPDIVEETNLNRLVGATPVDVLTRATKLHLATRIIYSLQTRPKIQAYPCRWQEKPEPLRECRIVFGCLDSYRERSELEIACRRYLMHYIDIGMDVHGDDPPVIGGQVILSSPGGPCMKCMGFLTNDKLAEEAGQYKNAGGRPQVIWPNGVLASTAVGLGVDLATNWSGLRRSHAYLVHDGNLGTVRDSLTLQNLRSASCPHFPLEEVGDPVFMAL